MPVIVSPRRDFIMFSLAVSISLASLVLCFGYLLVRWKLRKFYELSAKLIGPPDYPFVGSAFMLAGKTTEGANS